MHNALLHLHSSHYHSIWSIITPPQSILDCGALLNPSLNHDVDFRLEVAYGGLTTSLLMCSIAPGQMTLTWSSGHANFGAVPGIEGYVPQVAEVVLHVLPQLYTPLVLTLWTGDIVIASQSTLLLNIKVPYVYHPTRILRLGYAEQAVFVASNYYASLLEKPPIDDSHFSCAGVYKLEP